MPKLLTLMYHRVHDPIHALPTEHFRQHLTEIAQQYHVVTPEDPLSKDKLNICLTFDDAYCDFYGVVFPLLKALNIKAILAVPAAFIHETTELPLAQRYQVPYPEGMDEVTSREKVPFCTWQELKEMVESGHVMIASHGFAHASLSDKGVDLHTEVIKSKQLLEEKLKTSVHYFIYPYGNFTRKVHQLIKQHYKLGFRIGSATNPHFNPSNKMIYRVDADHFWKTNRAISPSLAKLNRKYWLNKIRFK